MAGDTAGKPESLGVSLENQRFLGSSRRRAAGSSEFDLAPSVERALPGLYVQRLVMNTAGRMVFTFLPALARGAGMSVGAFSAVLFARDLTGLIGPWAGSLIRRIGTWRSMVIGGLIGSLSMFLVAIGPIGVVIGFVVWGVARSVFLVGMSTWVGDVVVYERRGRLSGRIEFTWAGAALVGLPAMGVLIDAFGWRAAPIVLGLLGLPVAAYMHRLGALESDTIEGDLAAQTITSRRIPESQVRVVMSRSTIAALVGLGFLTASAQFLFLSHGLWLEDTYGFDSKQAGFAIVAVGGAELVASWLSSRLVDRSGKRWSIVVGIGVLALAYVGFILWPAPPQLVGLPLLMLAFLGFEYAIVSSIPLVSQLEPKFRSEIVGRSIGLKTVTRATATLGAGWLYVNQGFRTTMVVGGIVAFAALATIALLVDEPASDSVPGVAVS